MTVKVWVPIKSPVFQCPSEVARACGMICTGVTKQSWVNFRCFGRHQISNVAIKCLSRIQFLENSKSLSCNGRIRVQYLTCLPNGVGDSVWQNYRRAWNNGGTFPQRFQDSGIARESFKAGILFS